MLSTTQRYFNNPALLVTASLLLLAVIGVIDYLTGIQISFSIFYLIPTALVVWYGNRRFGLLFALLSALIWLLADLLGGHIYSHPLIPFWNCGVRLGFFLIISLFLNKIKEQINLEKRLSRIDFLTGIYNRRAFFELANRQLEWCRQRHHAMTIAYIDCDNFKMVNDLLGHQHGDALLRSVAATIQNNLRIGDIVARLGGDEFAIFLPYVEQPAVEELLGRLQVALLHAMAENGWPVTFSIGAITFTHPQLSIEEMVHKADRLMYEVKRENKNTLKYVVEAPG